MNKESNIPLYYQVYQDLLGKILSSQWADGQQLPTEEQLCDLYAASRITIRRALQMLEHEGHLTRTPGKGTFVRHETANLLLHHIYSFSDIIHGFGNSDEFRSLLLRFEIMTCPPEACQLLEITSSDSVYYLERVRYKGKMPFAYGFSILPCAQMPELTAESIRTLGLYGAIRSLGGDLPSRAKENFQAVLMDSKSAKRLNRPAKSAALSVQRIGYFNEIPNEFSRSILGGDSIRYEIQLT
ncbi:MAG: GntR family transcriptional regulator [Clostridiaceae bacterium]|nr:GntR family transcriptional regulator [Clostridiaceae bacterium]